MFCSHSNGAELAVHKANSLQNPIEKANRIRRGNGLDSLHNAFFVASHQVVPYQQTETHRTCLH